MPHSSYEDQSLRAWLPVFAIAFAAFIFNTTEFVPVGLLPEIAASFNMDVSRAGLLMTGYAWSVALLALPLTVFTSKIERRKLLVALFLVFVVSHILAGYATSFATLMAARIGIACSHAIFWSISTPLAMRLAPKGKRAKALAFVVTGSSLATVMGVPLGTIIGQQVGWRATFLCIGAVAFIVLLVLAYLLPKLPSSNSGSFKSVPMLLKRPALLHIYALVTIVIVGDLVAYTYIKSFMMQVGQFDEQFIVYLLLFFGASGIIGSVVFTRYSDRHPIYLLVGTLVAFTLSLLLLHVAALTMVTAILICMVWGMMLTLLIMLLQAKIMVVAADATDVAIAIFSGIINAGIGAGALIGGYAIIHFGIEYIGYVGAFFGALGLFIAIFSRKYFALEPKVK